MGVPVTGARDADGIRGPTVPGRRGDGGGGRAFWRNRAGNIAATPARIVTPGSEAELASVVARAAASGMRVRAVGAGHSFSNAAETEGVLVSLDRLRGLVRVDAAPDGTSVAVLRAGTRLRELPRILGPHGLALANQGDIDHQSIAGAISTGTHGTGLGFTGLAAMVRSLRLVTAAGDVLDLDANTHPELFDCARLSLGALGIITEVGLACVPAFDLVADEQSMGLGEAIDGFEARSRAVDHTEFFWFPQADRALVKVNRRVAPGEPSPDARALGPVRRFVDEEVVNNGMHAVACRLGRAVPRLVVPINRVATGLISGRRYRAASHDVFVSPRRVRFVEMEYGVPLADAAEVLRELRRRIEGGGWRVSFPIEVRAAAADDVPLSTAYGRETAYIAVHRFIGEPYRAYFAALEPVLVAAGGRPHWGKVSTLGADELAERYPRFGDVVSVRDRLDPDRVFGSPYLERVLGA